MIKQVIKIFIIMSIILLVVGCSFNKKEKEEKTDTIEELIKDVTKKEQDNIVFKNIKIESVGASNIVKGNVTNKNDDTRTFKLTLKLFNDENNRLIGKVQIDIENLAKDETRDFEISLVGDYSRANSFEVIVE